MTDQLTLTGDVTDQERQRPATIMECQKCGAVLWRSEWNNHTHQVESADTSEPGDESPYDEFDADDEVGKWYDITLSYSVDYRFRVPACTDHRAEEIAKEWQLDARPADSQHVHTDRREVGSIERQELPDDWGPYGGQPIHEALEEVEDDAQ